MADTIKTTPTRTRPVEKIKPKFIFEIQLFRWVARQFAGRKVATLLVIDRDNRLFSTVIVDTLTTVVILFTRSERYGNSN